MITKHGVLSIDGATRSVLIRRLDRRVGFNPILEVEVVNDSSNVGRDIDFAFYDEMHVLGRNKCTIKEVIFNDPATIVIWSDGTKTVVKCQPGDVYSKETGLALCIAKKYLGNKGNFNEVFKKYIKEES